MAHSLLVARQFSSSSGSSSACPGCDRDVDLEVAPLSDPVMGATLAFAILNFIALAVLFVLGCLTRKFVARDGKPRTRFGLLWALGFYTMCVKSGRPFSNPPRAPLTERAPDTNCSMSSTPASPRAARTPAGAT